MVKSPQGYIIVLLTLTTIGGAGVAWNQWRELVELRAAALDTDERAEWQKRAWDLEKMNRELQDQLAALRTGGPDDAGALVDDAGRPAPEPGRRPGGGRGGRGPNGPQQQLNAIRDLVAKPEVQALLRVQQQAAIDARYTALFQNLNLQPAQIEKLKNYLAERQVTVQDVMTAARDQGIDPRSDPAGFRQLIADSQNEINNGIKSLIGDAGYSQLQNYERTLPQRNLVNDLQQRLSYSSTPLTAAQADQLVQILADTAPSRGANNGGAPNPGQPPPFRGGGGLGGGPGGDLGGMLAGAFGGAAGGLFNAMVDVGGGARGGATAPVTSAAINQAQAVLAPQQLTALQQIQQQQQSQQQLQQLVRESLGNPGAGRGGNAQGAQPGPATGGGQNPRGGG